MVRRWSLLAVCLATGLLGAARAAWSAGNLVFVPLPPCRVIDTRMAGAGGPLSAGTARSFFFRGPTRDYATTPNQGGSSTGCGIPDLTSDSSPFQNIAKAVAINIVAVGPAGAGDLRAWPANQSVPTASVINYAAVSGLNIANGVIVPMCDQVAATPCASGDITFRADVSATNLVVDVVGYFHAGSTAFAVTNTALGDQALQANTTGTLNTALGALALRYNTTGYCNTAVGKDALEFNTSGTRNTADGFDAMRSNTTGYRNVAVGAYALVANTAGYSNTAVGASALSFGTGFKNTAVGARALLDSTGSNNIAIGNDAGLSATSGSNNILIGNSGNGAESSAIRVGTSQAITFIAGIRGVTTGSASAIPVLIDSNGQLGTVSSSIRFKEDVHDLGSISDRVLALRPVAFRYKKPYADGERPVQYGLIAEEVEKVFPELVVRDKDGQPETVKYQDLPTLLLNELEKEHHALAALRAEKDAEIAALRRENDEGLARLLARVEALEMQSRPAPSPATERPAPERR